MQKCDRDTCRGVNREQQPVHSTRVFKLRRRGVLVSRIVAGSLDVLQRCVGV